MKFIFTYSNQNEITEKDLANYAKKLENIMVNVAIRKINTISTKKDD